MKIIILYNPNSTGDGKANAEALLADLKKKKQTVEVMKTTHPGHGEEIALKYAQKKQQTLLISASGDGGYHEVVNGALKKDNANLVVAVLPSGNANDHYSAIGGDSLVDAIAKEKIQHIDTIRVSATVDGRPWVRFAHSYVGIGVTATTAKELTEERPNVITEKWIVARSLLSFRSVKLRVNGKLRRYSSILFANIDTMSKVMKLSDGASVKDGKFEMSAIRFRSKLRLLAYLLTAATVGLKKTQSLERYECETVTKLPLQLDGETYVIDSGSTLIVESVKQNLRCIL